MTILRTINPKDSNKRDENTHTRKGREDICPYCGKKTMSIKNHMLQHTGEFVRDCIYYFQLII